MVSEHFVNALTIEDLMVFVAVVDHGSFTQAADILGMSKSMVSKRVTRLERDLGVSLLTRSTRHLTTTEIGQKLYQNSVYVKKQIDLMLASVTQEQLQPRGVLRINAPLSFGHLHLAPAITEFMKQYPTIKVELLLGPKYEDLIACGIDLAIRLGEQPDSRLIARRLMSSRMAVCASPSYIERNGVPSHPRDLVNHNCLLYHQSPTGETWRFQDGKENLEIRINGNLSASSAQALESAALHGLGLVLLPDYMMVDEIESGLLKRMLVPYCKDAIDVYAVYPETRHVAPKVRLFIDHMIEYCSAHCVLKAAEDKKVTV